MADLAARFVRTNRVAGSYLEFGVYRGASFSHFYHLFKRRYGLPVDMFAFDSFQGLPTPSGVDAGGGNSPQGTLLVQKRNL